MSSEDCMLCTQEGKGNCSKEDATYSITCTEGCQIKEVYQGKTGYNAYTRGAEHPDEYNKKNPKSMLVEYCNLAPEGRRVAFKRGVTGIYHHDSTK